MYTKEDYYSMRVDTLKEKIDELNEVLVRNKQGKSNNSNFINEFKMNEIKEFCNARMNRNLIGIFKYRNLCRKEAYFEMLIKYMPELVVKYLLKKLK